MKASIQTLVNIVSHSSSRAVAGKTLRGIVDDINKTQDIIDRFKARIHMLKKMKKQLSNNQKRADGIASQIKKTRVLLVNLQSVMMPPVLLFTVCLESI